MSAPAADRIRTLLLRADNTLKNHVPGGDDATRRTRAHRTLEEARKVAEDPGVPSAVRELVDRRLTGLDTLEEAHDGSATA